MQVSDFYPPLPPISLLTLPCTLRLQSLFHWVHLEGQPKDEPQLRVWGLNQKSGLNVTLMRCEAQLGRAGPAGLGTPKTQIKERARNFPRQRKIASIY